MAITQAKTGRRLQAIQHQPFIAVGVARLQLTLLDLVAGVHHQRGGGTFGVAGDALLRREDRVIHDAFIHSGADEHARQKLMLRVREDGAQGD